MSESIRVYWQPGCTSCLRTREFLEARDIGYESINVRKSATAMDELARFGARSIPVVARGDQWIYAQDLDTLADFVGVEIGGEALPVAALVEQLDRVLAAGQRFASQIPLNRLQDRLPGRNRSYLDLGYHLFVVAEGFLEAVRGGELTEVQFLKKPPPEFNTGAHVAAFGSQVRDELGNWWQSNQASVPDSVQTFYGAHSTRSVLERTCWHAAQHCRQLESLLVALGIEPDGRLGAMELDGLPMPEKVWDDEAPLEG